ncbi:MAG: hypothetical protein LM590_17015 [Thermofilum sp.]|nr:hypothetical protein [Thermofilum sp.]
MARTPAQRALLQELTLTLAASLLLAAIHALPPETKENFVLTASNPSLLTLLAHNHVRFELDTHGHARWVLAPP